MVYSKMNWAAHQKAYVDREIEELVDYVRQTHSLFAQSKKVEPVAAPVVAASQVLAPATAAPPAEKTPATEPSASAEAPAASAEAPAPVPSANAEAPAPAPEPSASAAPAAVAAKPADVMGCLMATLPEGTITTDAHVDSICTQNDVWSATRRFDQEVARTGKGAGFAGDPKSIDIMTRPVSRNDTLSLALAPGGGAAIRISTVNPRAPRSSPKPPPKTKACSTGTISFGAQSQPSRTPAPRILDSVPARITRPLGSSAYSDGWASPSKRSSP